MKHNLKPSYKENSKPRVSLANFTKIQEEIIMPAFHKPLQKPEEGDTIYNSLYKGNRILIPKWEQYEKGKLPSNLLKTDAKILKKSKPNSAIYT